MYEFLRKVLKMCFYFELVRITEFTQMKTYCLASVTSSSRRSWRRRRRPTRFSAKKSSDLSLPSSSTRTATPSRPLIMSSTVIYSESSNNRKLNVDILRSPFYLKFLGLRKGPSLSNCVFLFLF